MDEAVAIWLPAGDQLVLNFREKLSETRESVAHQAFILASVDAELKRLRSSARLCG